MKDERKPEHLKKTPVDKLTRMSDVKAPKFQVSTMTQTLAQLACRQHSVEQRGGEGGGGGWGGGGEVPVFTIFKQNTTKTLSNTGCWHWKWCDMNLCRSVTKKFLFVWVSHNVHWQRTEVILWRAVTRWTRCRRTNCPQGNRTFYIL